MKLVWLLTMSAITLFAQDRAISITGVEQQSSKRYRVTAKSWLFRSGTQEPTMLYQLSCDDNGGFLGIGKTYTAGEGHVENNSTKLLVIFAVTKPLSMEKMILACQVDGVKAVQR
jgi:hypothetical protein